MEFWVELMTQRWGLFAQLFGLSAIAAARSLGRHPQSVRSRLFLLLAFTVSGLHALLLADPPFGWMQTCAVAAGSYLAYRLGQRDSTAAR